MTELKVEALRSALLSLDGATKVKVAFGPVGMAPRMDLASDRKSGVLVLPAESAVVDEPKQLPPPPPVLNQGGASQEATHEHQE